MEAIVCKAIVSSARCCVRSGFLYIVPGHGSLWQRVGRQPRVTLAGTTALSLGWNAYIDKSRSHMVNIVTLADGKRYMVDVGFGGNGPTQPLPLDSEHPQFKNIAPADVRLLYDNILENTNRSQKLWIYQHRNYAQSRWLPMYCFTELEFLPQDYEAMNFQTSQSRTSWFTYKIVVVKMILEEGEVVGTLMLVGGDLKRRIKGRTEDFRHVRLRMIEC